MTEDVPVFDAQRLLVVMPTWLGDCVMAMPTLSALRALYPDAHITALVGATVRPIIDPNPWINRTVTVRGKRRGKPHARRVGPIRLAARLAAGHFDTAVILPNSFRSALVTAMAKIPRRVGYDRDGRGVLLTDRLLARRTLEGFVPVPTRDYYLGLARYLGSADPDPAMRLFTRPKHDAQADELLRRGGFDPDAGRRLVLLNPGANYGDAKMWYPQRFAEVADRCADELGAFVAVNGSPKERAILDRVLAAAKTPILDLSAAGMTLSLLKSVVRRASVMVTNDTGPRHVAAALGTPVVTVFGPTDPAWTEIGFQAERQVSVKVFCGPCQKKKCPLDHRCMTRIDAEMVARQAIELVEGVGVPANPRVPGDLGGREIRGVRGGRA
jgi:lipopolysaccharide heptosyltransferase II